ncbi:hypothetical protein K493DRAFT_311450 [Basidiobolus meristosporus CBS 931.73]|uniref:Velvet domain-containing protein n=1 Tax=Basidiobolus meristosporus CBS 931.73 TaxID=1314790 RepID=A0A1Y1Z1S8_9FUNG|nr:hypothetical protein K493DRAFT_272700 [Basidiobolus meristosporus CBS 931.73]ORY04251.1 hypothetical protein K493DRAFT_311450 [Basidiobolus meristosporus CBS 931.73]|eukprot:ORX63291.1 hypothetical protein K493DRAFT_272700 [Basidiobolus meristosporus CBS 931.73]
MTRYSLEILQQPTRARMCGFGDKDRRLIGPLPILELKTNNTTTENTVEIANFVVHADLWSADFQHDCNVVVNPASIPTSSQERQGSSIISLGGPVNVRNLIGCTVSSSYQLRHMDGNPGVFFLFPDLSVRVEGKYRLRFSLWDIMRTWKEGHNYMLTHVYSEPFTVYPPRSFPGMADVTPLSDWFSNQGMKLSLRRHGEQ